MSQGQDPVERSTGERLKLPKSLSQKICTSLLTMQDIQCATLGKKLKCVNTQRHPFTDSFKRFAVAQDF